MNHPVLTQPIERSETDYVFPSVSIFLPFNPKMDSKRDIAKALKMAVDKAEQKLFDDFSFEMAMLVMHKLKAILQNLNFSSHKKSVAIFVSPVFEKVFYLNMEIEERVLVDSSFDIRNLIKSKKQMRQYLVLQISNNECRIFANRSGQLETVFLYSTKNECDDSEITMQNFLKRIDNTLHFILKSYNLPLFILGNEILINQFRAITVHAASVIEFISSEQENANVEYIKNVLIPYLQDWEKIKYKLSAAQLTTETKNNNLSVGMRDVFKAAGKRNGRLLLVEEGFEYPSETADSEEIIYKATKPYSRYSYIRNAVDEVIERVLDNDGDVEFVSKSLLERYNHIALLS